MPSASARDQDVAVSMEQGMGKYKAFTRLLIITLAVFAVINYLLWICFTRQLFMPDSRVSDLVRLSYLFKIRQERGAGVDLPKRHFQFSEFKGGRVDMITVGDSFSIGGGEGKNAYYQDYIASNNNFTVVNFRSKSVMGRPGMSAPVNALAVLYNSGMLDRLKPRYVLLETVERYAPDRLVDNFSFDDTEPLDKLLAHYAAYKPVNVLKKEKASFINTGNVKLIKYNIKDLFAVTKINDDVYRAKLRQNMFSGSYGDRLYYYYDEYTNSVNITNNTMRTMNDNLNFIADKLAEKNIRLVFMPIVNKLNLYGAYADPPRNDSIFFEELRKLPKKYLFIDTKALLRDALQRGEKDIFYKDDTHWSWKASEIIFDAVRFH